MKNFEQTVKQIGKDNMNVLLNNLSKIKSRIYILSWLLNDCDNNSQPNTAALEFEEDTEINKTNLLEFTEMLLKKLADKIKPLINSLIDSNMYKYDEIKSINDLEYDHYHVGRKFFNELDMPGILAKILTFLFDCDKISKNTEYFVFEYYDFELYPAVFATKKEADEFVNDYGDAGTLFYVTKESNTSKATMNEIYNI